jgi:hypothetical protein
METVFSFFLLARLLNYKLLLGRSLGPKKKKKRRLKKDTVLPKSEPKNPSYGKRILLCPHTVQSDTTRCGDSRVGHPGRAKHHLSILLRNNASEQYYITIG